MKKTVNIKNNTITGDIFSQYEKSSVILSHNETYMYERLYEQLNTYLQKMNNNNVKYAITDVIEKKLVFISISNLEPNAKDGSINVHIMSDKLSGIILNNTKDSGFNLINDKGTETFDIDIDDIETVVYNIYHGIIKAIILLNFEKIKNDEYFASLMIKYIHYFVLKSLNMPKLKDKQSIILYALIIYFYNRFMLHFRHTTALVYVNKYVPAEYKLEISNLFIEKDLKKYNSFKSLFYSLYDFGITIDPPNTISLKLLKSLKSKSFLTLDHILTFIPAIILSKYPYEFYDQLFINMELQNNIEKKIIKNVKHISYNSTYIKGLFGDKK